MHFFSVNELTLLLRSDEHLNPDERDNMHKESGVTFPILIGGRKSIKKPFVNLFTRHVKKQKCSQGKCYSYRRCACPLLTL